MRLNKYHEAFYIQIIVNILFYFELKTRISLFFHKLFSFFTMILHMMLVLEFIKCFNLHLGNI